MKKMFYLVLFFCAFAQAAFSQEIVLNAAITAEWKNVNNQAMEMISHLPQLNLFKQCAHCWCVVSYNDLDNKESESGVCLSLTDAVGKEYCGLGRQTWITQGDCEDRCSEEAEDLNAAQKQAIADCMCDAKKKTGDYAKAFGRVGTWKFRDAETVGKLVHVPAKTVTTCVCPQGWLSNTTNVNGGITADGKCKKPVCGPIIGCDPIANGTPIGTWGFTWGNWIWAWGTATNGGKPTCITVTTPRQCYLE